LTDNRGIKCRNYLVAALIALSITLVMPTGFANASSGSETNLSIKIQDTTSNDSNTGILVPLYIYPGADWTKLVTIKKDNSDVEIVAIINPDNGAGSVRDSNYVNGIKALKSAGISVIGYVWTDYGARSISAAKAEINRYKTWYSVSGIFLDSMSNVPGHEGYYKTLTDYAKSKGLKNVIGNPGADTQQSYIGTVDTLNIYEGANVPDPSYFSGWHSDYGKKNFSFIAYGITNLDNEYIKEISQYVGLLYLTDDSSPNPFDSLPSYLAELAQALHDANAG